MMIDSARKLSFYMIDEFMAANHLEIVQNGAEPENRYASKKIHWHGRDGLAHCHTLAKNPRLTTVPDLVNCQRYMPEAMSKQAIIDELSRVYND